MTNTTDSRLSNLWIYLFLIGITVILLYPVIFEKTDSFCIKQDNVQQAYPFFSKLNSSLHKGYLPVWDANTYGGRSFAGEIQPGIFYPLNIIWCYLFGSVNSIDVYYLDLLVALHYLICLIGMYRLASLFRLPTAAAVAAGLVFTFTSSMSARSSGQTWTFFGLSLLPWVVYFVVKYYQQRRRWRYFVFSGLVAGLQILAGHIEPFFHSMLICAIIVLFYEFRDRKGPLSFFAPVAGKLTLIILVACILASPQLYYTAQYLPDCYRYVSGGMYIKMGHKVPFEIYSHWFIIKPEYLGNLFGLPFSQPDDDNIIYMGILPLFLMTTWIVWRRAIRSIPEHQSLTRLLLIILVFGILSVLGYLTIFCLILYTIPLVNAVRELGRYTVLISFSGSLLTGLAITYIGRLRKQLFGKRANWKSYVLIALSINAIYLSIFRQDQVPVSVPVTYLLCIAFFLYLAFEKKPENYAFLAVAVICGDLLLNSVNYLPAQISDYPTSYYARNRIIDFLETTYGKYRVDFRMEDYSLIRRNLGDVYPIQIKYGYVATVNSAYYEFVYDPRVPQKEKDDLLNIRYVLADHQLDSNYTLRDSLPHLQLYERNSYYPRCYWQRQLGEAGPLIEKENTVSIRQVAYTDLDQKISVDCTQADTLIFSENCYPGWKCYDNGIEVKIYPATISHYRKLFRSVFLGVGHHLIEFKYNKVFGWF